MSHNTANQPMQQGQPAPQTSQQPTQQPVQQPQQQQTVGQAAKRQPEDTIRDGALKATIWRQQGKDRDFFTTRLATTYKDQHGNLKDGYSFTKNDLLGVAELCRRAHARVQALSREEFKSQRKGTQQQQAMELQQPQAPAQEQGQ